MDKKEDILFNKNQIEVFLFGRKLFLSESTTRDYIDYTQFSIENNQNKSIDFLLFQSAHVLHCALKCNFDSIPKFRFIKRRVVKWLISEKNIMDNLSQSQLNSYVEIVLKLEGLWVDPKKKVYDNIGNSEFLGSEQGYSLLMNAFNWTVKQIDNLPISKYFMFTKEAFNLAMLQAGGKYQYSSAEDKMMYKKRQAFWEIQELKRTGWSIK